MIKRKKPIIPRSPRSPRNYVEAKNGNSFTTTDSNCGGLYVAVNIGGNIYNEEGYFTFITPTGKEAISSKEEYLRFLQDIEGRKYSSYRIIKKSIFSANYSVDLTYNQENNKISFELGVNLCSPEVSKFGISATVDDDLWAALCSLYEEDWY